VRTASLPMAPYLIVLTSRSEPGDVVEALRAGADDHITKPFEIAEASARGCSSPTPFAHLSDREVAQARDSRPT